MEKHRSRDIGLSPLYFASFFPFVKQFQNGKKVQVLFRKLVFIWQSLLSVLPPKPQRQVLPLASVQQMHGRETYSQRLSNASAPDKCNRQPLGIGYPCAVWRWWWLEWCENCTFWMPKLLDLERVLEKHLSFHPYLKRTSFPLSPVQNKRTCLTSITLA